MKKIFLFLSLALVLVVSCKKDEEPTALPFDEQLAIDLQKIDAYLEDNNIKDVLKDCQTGENSTPPDCDGDVSYIVLENGSGLYINNLDIPFIASYKGRLMETGVEFDASDSANFTLRRVIIGWQAVLLDSRGGDSLRLYIPSGYAYGFAGSGEGVPSNSNLIFDIKILQVN